MPFTFSHPAIVLPLTFLPQRWFSLTGLVIGSLIPDFEYFIRMRVESHYSHSLNGLFWFDLPLGLILAFVFHNVARNSLFDNLPQVLRGRVYRFKGFDWNAYFSQKWLIVLLSILVGAASHLLWDGFTHEHGYFIDIVPGLINEITLFGKQLPVWKVLQHFSTLIGGLVICMGLWRLPINSAVKQLINLRYWYVVLGITSILVSLRFIFGLNSSAYGHVIVSVISSILISLILTPLLIDRIKRAAV